MKVTIGLIIDLDSIPNYGNDDSFVNDENSPLELNFNDSIGSTKTEASPNLLRSTMNEKLLEKLEQLQLYILEQLTRDSTISERFNPTNVQFVYRFFRSTTFYHPAKKMDQFVSFNVEEFELFENSLAKEVQRVQNGNTGEAEKDQSSEQMKLSLVSGAFKSLIAELQWPSAPDPKEGLVTIPLPTPSSKSLPRTASTTSTKSNDSISPQFRTDENNEEVFRNHVYIFFRVPRDEDELQAFVDDTSIALDVATSSRNFLNAFVTKIFAKHVTHKYQIRVNFVDLWELDESLEQADSSKTTNANSVVYPRALVKVLQHFHGGKVLLPNYPNPTKLTVPGLPDWKSILKTHLIGGWPNRRSPFISSGSGSLKREGSVMSELSSKCSTPTTRNVDPSSKTRDILTKAILNNSSTHSKGFDLRSRTGGGSRSGSLAGDSSSRGLRRNALLNSQSFSGSTQGNRTRSTKFSRFGTGVSQTIMMNRSMPSSVLSLTQGNLTYLGLNGPVPLLRRDSPSSASSSSKKVRRNLFQGDGNPTEGIKRLLASTSQINYDSGVSSPRAGSISRQLFSSPVGNSEDAIFDFTSNSIPSPSAGTSFKSPNGSNFLRSRRRLDLGDSRSSPLEKKSPVEILSQFPGDWTSPSPVTPPSKRTRRLSLTSNLDSPGPSTSASFFKIYERPVRKHDSSTFYSQSSDSHKDKAKSWVESGRKIQAAIIKEKSLDDLSTINLDDLELLNPLDSPLPKGTIACSTLH